MIGGGLLLLTLIFDDLFGGILNAIHLGFDLGGVSPTPVLLGFVAMFGIGGLFGLHSFGLGPGGATIVGLVSGAVGAGIVLGAFRVLASAESTESFGSVLISFAGASHNIAATADAEIPAGRMVKVVAVAGNNLVVTPTSTVSTEGARSDA